jgi:hypothetical protein
MHFFTQINSLSRPRQRSLLKLAYRGGVLRLSAEQISTAAGWFGTGQARHYPLAGLERIALSQHLPSDGWRGVRINFYWVDGRTLECIGVGPLAAERLCHMINVLHPGITIE